jgi:RsiW-degrading membrane proteinase PrsW (M82 family)
LTQEAGAEGLEVGVELAVNNALIRAVSLVFFHAVWSGIVAYFLVVATIQKHRRVALVVVGVSAGAVLHATHNWLLAIQPTFSVAVDLVAIALFYTYLAKLRQLVLPAGNVNAQSESQIDE